MSSSIFTTMLKRQIDLFVATFQNDGNALFKNERNALIHPGEYGMYREQRFRSLLQSFLTRNYSVSDGFIISSVNNNVTTQCDVLVHNAFSMPLTDGGLGKFYPVEDIYAIIEIKSDLDKPAFIKALRKLAEVKMIGNDRNNPHINKNTPMLNYHTIPTFLVCNKLRFSDINSLDFETIYTGIDRKYWHNAILSIEDGVLMYKFAVADLPLKSNEIYRSHFGSVCPTQYKTIKYQYSQHIIKFGKTVESYDCTPVLYHSSSENKYDHIMTFLMMIMGAINDEVKYSFDSVIYLDINKSPDYTEYHSAISESIIKDP